MPMEVESVTSSAGFDALEAEWKSLHRECGAKAFQSYEWLRAWWRHLGEHRRRLQLRILVARHEGRIVGIGPFALQTVRVLGLVKMRRVVFLGAGITDHLDLLALPERSAEVCTAFAENLAGTTEWDTIWLVDVPDGSPLLEHFVKTLCVQGVETRKQIRVYCPRAPLLESWPKTLAGFESERRRKLTFLDRRLKKNFRVALRPLAVDTDVPAAIDAFIEMHQAHWARRGHGGAFRKSQMVSFMKEVGCAFHANGWLVLSFLETDGMDAAALLGFQLGQELQIYLTGVSDLDRVAKYSPGTALFSYCLEQAIDRGARVCDFLRGPGRYKYQYGGVDVPNWTILVFRTGVARVHTLHRVHMLLTRVGKYLRSTIRPLRRRLTSGFD